MKKTICIVLTMLLLSSSSLISQETPTILFDEYHATWKPSILADVLSELEKNGYSASFSKERISSSLLSGHDILVLMIPYRGFSDDEKEAIQDFVKNGGGLIIFGEHGPYMDYKGITNPVNSISTLFGIEFNTDAVSDPENCIDEDGWILMITNFKSHPVTKGVETMVYVSGCSLKVKSPATGLAFGSPTTVADGQEGRDIVVLAAAEYGKGKVLAIGDTDFLAGSNTPGYEGSDYMFLAAFAQHGLLGLGIFIIFYFILYKLLFRYYKKLRKNYQLILNNINILWPSIVVIISVIIVFVIHLFEYPNWFSLFAFYAYSTRYFIYLGLLLGAIYQYEYHINKFMTKTTTLIH